MKLKVKVKVKGFYSLKTYHRTLHFTPLVTGPVHPCAISTPRGAYILQPFRRIELIVHITISVLLGIQSSEAFEGEASCPSTHHVNNVPRLRGEKHDISLKILHQTGFETARQAATSAERHPLTIAPCPSLLGN